LRLDNNSCAVLFAGSGWHRKGLRFAIDAINQTPSATLLVAGSGSRTGLPSSHRTRFLGPVTQIRPLMESSDLFLLPTLYDPFSNASLEAMAAGLPVITTAANGFSEIMRSDLDGEIITDPTDTQAIAAAIEKWHQNETPATRASRREEARRHTIEENVRQTLAALTSLIPTP
jgi:UDP-glucose:(heptosyl)LPS alpha-1,3-glucosyltransferase